MRSFRNFATATVFSVITSTLFFLISPISEAQSELLARTQPTVYDVLIAFFGGLAGIVASSTKSKGNVIPGVAIATALMPPYRLNRFEFIFLLLANVKITNKEVSYLLV